MPSTVGDAGHFDYDVALSFAGEDRRYVQRVAQALIASGLHVFYDQIEQTDLWGKDLYSHLRDVYQKRARYTVLFISRHYARKAWTNHERLLSQSRAFSEYSDQILPARFDDSEVPGLLSTVAYIDLRQSSPEEVATLVVSKLRSASPSQAIPAGGEPPTSDREPPRGLRTKPDDDELPLLLYSVCTSVAFRINEQYYRQLHFAWCAPYFDLRRNQVSGIGKSPPSSNPFEIYAALLRDARAGDLHSSMIRQNRDGIRKGAASRFAKGQITEQGKKEIERILELTVASDYTPLIYVIPTYGVGPLVRKAAVDERAHPFSPEYIIEDLPRHRFDIITTEDPLLI